MHKDASTDFCFWGDNYIMKKVRVVSFAWDTPTGSPFIPIIHYQVYQSYGVHKDASTDFLLQGRLHNEESESCLSCTGHAYWSSSSSLTNIIKLFQFWSDGLHKISASWEITTQVVSCMGTSTAPPLHSFQISQNMSKDIKVMKQPRIHLPISASTEITT